jgi:hypothetical protein
MRDVESNIGPKRDAPPESCNMPNRDRGMEVSAILLTGCHIDIQV